MRRRHALAAGLIAVAISGAVASLPQSGRLEGLSLDTLFFLRYKAFGQLHPRDSSPSVVVALDEETYRTPPFADKPSAFWTPQIGKVLTATVEAGAKVVGFDAVFPTSADSVFRAVDDRIAAGYDRPFLLALRNAARENKVLLGKVQHSTAPVRPFQAQSFAVGNDRNIRSLNLLGDQDDSIRRAPLFFRAETAQGGGRTETSMSLELAARARGAAPESVADGRVRLGDYTIPGSERNALGVNFDGGDDVPTYSLADLYACAEKGDAEFFKQHFAGKVVLIGAVLDLEDRKVTSKRFIAGGTPEPAARCVPRAAPYREGAGAVRDTIPGVYIHAAAVNNLLRHEVLQPLPFWSRWLICLALALYGSGVAMLCTPAVALVALAGGAIAYTLAAVSFFRHAIALPYLSPIVGAVFVLAVVVAYRFIVAEKDKRLLRKSFSLYLAPAVVDELIRAEKPPVLGGEQRIVTVYCSDLAGFTTLSETMDPHELVAVMNEYLSAMTDVIEQHHGFVDNFIGDAIVAVFGAPVDDPDHARHAVQAAIACRKKLDELNETSAIFAGRKLKQRIGLNCGEALVGNIGSRRRLKYTVMGDTVNLASRLEGANKIYGTRILVSEDAMARAGEGIRWREIDRVRVVGRKRPVTILEPLADDDAVPVDVFARALADYRAARFEDAAARFAELAEADGPARTWATRAKALVEDPPGREWDPVTTLQTK